MASKGTTRKLQHPHYRLEDPTTQHGVAQTIAGYRVVPLHQADTFTHRAAAELAVGANAVDVVRVDA